MEKLERRTVMHSCLATFVPCNSFKNCVKKGDTEYNENKCRIEGMVYVGNCYHITKNCELARG